MFHCHAQPKQDSFSPLYLPPSRKMKRNPAHIIHTPAAMFRGLMVTQFQRPAKAQAAKKEALSDHQDQPCVPLASTCGRCVVGGKVWWPRRSLECREEPPFCSECCSNNYFPFSKCSPGRAPGFYVPRNYHCFVPRLSAQAVPGGSISEQHRASSAKT